MQAGFWCMEEKIEHICYEECTPAAFAIQCYKTLCNVELNMHWISMHISGSAHLLMGVSWSEQGKKTTTTLFTAWKGQNQESVFPEYLFAPLCNLTPTCVLARLTLEPCMEQPSINKPNSFPQQLERDTELNPPHWGSMCKHLQVCRLPRLLTHSLTLFCCLSHIQRIMNNFT